MLTFRLYDAKCFKERNKVYIPAIKQPKSGKKKDRLSGSASQMKRLLMILPVAIGDLIRDHNDKVWKMLLLLREICSNTHSPAISERQVIELDAMIEKYLVLRRECFPSASFRKKHHHWKHYPEMIYELGPLKHLSTLRYESLHGWMKDVMRSAQNYKNPSMTLSIKHEIKQCTLKNQYDTPVEAENIILYEAENCNEETASVIKNFFIKIKKSFK